MQVFLQMKPYQPPKYFCDDLTPSCFPKVEVIFDIFANFDKSGRGIRCNGQQR